MGALILAVLGCGGPVATASADRPAPISAASLGPLSLGPASATNIRTNVDGKVTIDAGVVFADRASYLCVPVKQLGIDGDFSTARIGTSCECVQGRVVAYRNSSGESELAVLLDFNPDPGHASSADKQSLMLGVIVTVAFTDGRSQEFTVDLVHCPSVDLVAERRE